MLEELKEWEEAGRRAVEMALRKIGKTHGVFGSITPTSPFFEEPLTPEELLDEAKETITGFFWLEGCFRGEQELNSLMFLGKDGHMPP